MKTKTYRKTRATKKTRANKKTRVHRKQKGGSNIAPRAIVGWRDIHSDKYAAPMISTKKMQEEMTEYD
jgi:hypothetical protein